MLADSLAKSENQDTKPLVHVPIIGIKDSLVTVDIRQVNLRKNEVAYILQDDQRLKAEVLRIHNDSADLQVFEDTLGVKVGDQVEMAGELLSITLGPGLLGSVYDGLQNPLHELASEYGFFLPRGVDVSALPEQDQYFFSPKVMVGDKVVAGQVLGTTQERHLTHKVMVPFNLKGQLEVTAVREGSMTVSEMVVRLVDHNQQSHGIAMSQRWPVRRPLAENVLKSGNAQRLYPDTPMITTQRVVDTFFPVALGGTACIPGPFGAGKTVLQSLLAKHSPVDVVIIIACGERAGEVVETITEYPETIDPRTGLSLMERTVIICNTSSMPVAAREASIYTGITIGEYYQQMGHNVLCIADSTSRWAQALRETSGRMEEIPGEEAFPAYLDSAIKAIYERAGVIQCIDKSRGTLTMIGTVSPAGGNFEEPVTQATLGTVKCFLGLSSDRAYKRFYPAIDPLISWSKYLQQLAPWYTEQIGKQWVQGVEAMIQLLHQGEMIEQMMQVTGEEGVSLEDYITWQKARLVDMVYLQQDAFDDVDASTPQERQIVSFELLNKIIHSSFKAESRDELHSLFVKITSLYRNWNYSVYRSTEYQSYEKDIVKILR